MLRLLLAALVAVAVWSPQRVERPSTSTAAAVDPASRAYEAMLATYLHGDADAAVETLARTLPDGMPSAIVISSANNQDPLLGRAASVMLSTEVGMRKGTFGRYARSAPLTPAGRSVGLTGYFEVNSLRTYRAAEDLLLQARSGHERVFIDFVRDWYVLTVSYCLRWHLDCGDALVAAGELAFGDDPEIDLLSGAVAETLGARSRAESLLRRALAARPSLTEARIRLGRILILRGRTTDARREISQALAEARTTHEWFGVCFGEMLLGQLDRQSGRVASARLHDAEASRLPLPRTADEPTTRSSDPWALYRAAEFWQTSTRVARMRLAFRD